MCFCYFYALNGVAWRAAQQPKLGDGERDRVGRSEKPNMKQDMRQDKEKSLFGANFSAELI